MVGTPVSVFQLYPGTTVGIRMAAAYGRGRPKLGESRPRPAKPKIRVHNQKYLNCVNCKLDKRPCNQRRPCDRCIQKNVPCLFADPEGLYDDLTPTTPNPTFSQVGHLGRLLLRKCRFLGESMLESGLMPDTNLLDHIHNAASRHLVPDPLKPLYSMDGSALMLFGIVAEEMIAREAESIREYLARVEPEGASSGSSSNSGEEESPLIIPTSE